MKKSNTLIKSGVYLLQLLITLFFFWFFFFPDKFDLRFQTLSSGSIHDPWSVRMAKLVVWILFMGHIIYLYRKFFMRKSERVSGIALSVVVVALTLILFEIGFMFFPQTHGVAGTKASALWVDKYYKPVNSLGYRDREPDLETRKKVVLFIGDSFTAGYGNKYVHERFSDMVAARLDTAVYEVYNLGIPGIDTREEAKRLREFPLRADVIVLAYFFNDIEVAAADHGYSIHLPPLYSGVPRLLRVWVDRLYFPNFIYWHLPGKSEKILDDFLHKTYLDPSILQTHLDDLGEIIRYKEENEAEMIAVMIPFLPDLQYSRKFTGPVSDYLDGHGVMVVNLEEEIGRLPVKERVVNNTDSHSSTKTNRIIAHKVLRAMGQSPE